MVFKVKVVIVICLSIILMATPLNAQNYQQRPIVLGSSSALTGPTSQLGLRLNQGAKLYFDEVNAHGGIHGRLVKLVALDDGYEPIPSIKNTIELSKHKELFALFNYVGTPTSYAVLNQVEHLDIPYITPFTGAEFLRNPVNKNVFNLRASYYQEAKAQIDYLIKNIKAERIGLLIQADEFGKSVEAGYLKALKGYDKEPVIVTRFRRNTGDVDVALDALIKHEVDAVAFVGTYKPFSTLINKGHEQGFAPFYSTVSFISSHDLFSRLQYGSRVLVTQVFPEPSLCKLEVCQDFMQVAKKGNLIDIDPIIFEGYLNAMLFTHVAQQCNNKLTRDCFREKIETVDQNFGGLKVSFSKDDHQGLDAVYFSFHGNGS